MALRSSRSRSRTPFVQLTRLEEEQNMANAIVSVKEKTIEVEERRTYHTRQKTIASTAESSVCDEVFESPATTRQKRAGGYARRRRQKTSDYSSEEEHAEGNGAVKSAYQVYQEAGEYWNKYPKTDYTYSLHSKDRIEVAPGVIGMPNMSRKSLRRSMEPSPTYNAVHTTYSSTTTSNNNVARKTLNFDETDIHTTTIRTSVFRRMRSSMRSVITRFYRAVATFLYVVYSTVETSMLWTARSYYKTVSRLFLFDTWLMQKTAGHAQSSKKYGALVAIMLLPLLLFAGWTLCHTIPPLIQESRIFQPSTPRGPISAAITDASLEALIAQRVADKLSSVESQINALKMRLDTINAPNAPNALNALNARSKCCKRQYIYLMRDARELDAFGAQLKREITALLSEKIIGAGGTVTNEQIHAVVQAALAVYDADKTGRVDYALESSGGQIISTRCTENYHSRTAVVSILGVPLWYPSNTPRVLITPGATPGECWAFQNFPGFVVIQLSTEVRVTGFSVEHIPESLAPGGARDSAPRGFTVWGLKSENDRNPLDFGRFEYRLEGPALQYFGVERPGAVPPVNMVELRVESNHGNINYTCLYRFRVHGSVT